MEVGAFAVPRKCNAPIFIIFFRLSPVQQPRERHHRAQVRLLRRGGDGLLHLLPQDALLQAQQAHHTLLLQRGEEKKEQAKFYYLRRGFSKD